jgi:membrane protease YdiL (CAAX protease family)
VVATTDEPSGPRRWSPWSAPLALIAGFAAALVGAVVVAVVGSIAGASVNHPPPSVQIADTVVQDGALVAAVILFAQSFGRVRPADFGLVPPRLWPAIGRMLAAGGTFFGFLLLWSAALNLHNKEKLLDQLGANKSAVAAAAVALLVCVIAPFSEEFVFRGYFFGALRNWRGPWVAAVLTGLVFGAIHAGSAPAGYLVPLAFFGFVLCLLRWRSGSLWPGIALHSINNSVALGAGLGWDWQIPVVIVGALVVLAAVALAIDRRIARPASAH